MIPPLLPAGAASLMAVRPDMIQSPGNGMPGYRDSDFDIAQMWRWARQDMDRWALRQERFERDQDLYRMAPPAQMPRNSQNLVTLNDPRTLVEKVEIGRASCRERV